MSDKITNASHNAAGKNKVNLAETKNASKETDTLTGEVISAGKTGFHVSVGGQNKFCLINNSFTGEEPPIVGDTVSVAAREDKFFITAIHPRKSALARYDEYKQKPRYFAANIDVMFIVTSANREFSPTRIKRFAALNDNENVRTVVVLTKTDIGDKKRVLHALDEIKKLGLPCADINALDPDGAQKLFKYWHAGECAVLVGSSGVGKSSLINSLAGLNLKTSVTQDDRRLNKGRHTTSARTLYYLESGRKIIDNPGVRIVGMLPETFD